MKLLSKILSMQWAITEEALDAIIQVAKREWTAADYEVFHKAAQADKIALLASLGDPVDGSNNAFVKGDTGILVFDGPIIPKASFMSAESGMISLDEMTADFKAFEGDKKIKRIVGLFDTPGGDIVGVSEFAALVKASSKPTFGHGFGLVASAGFWIFSAFDKRTAVDTALPGSIGVRTAVRKSGDDDTIEFVSSGAPKKSVDAETDEGKAQIQSMIDALEDVFVGAVATNMGVTPKTVKSKFGQGGLVGAKEALSVGMIDQITTLDALMSSFHQPNPAQGGDQRRVTMTLEEFLAQNPAAKVEFERDKAEAQAKELADAKIKAKRDADIDSASKFLGTEYGQRIQTMAAGVIKGEVSMESLSMAVSMHDETSEKIKSLEAKVESLENGPTPSGANLTDMQKELAEDNQIRANLGMKPLGMEA